MNVYEVFLTLKWCKLFFLRKLRFVSDACFSLGSERTKHVLVGTVVLSTV